METLWTVDRRAQRWKRIFVLPGIALQERLYAAMVCRNRGIKPLPPVRFVPPPFCLELVPRQYCTRPANKRESKPLILPPGFVCCNSSRFGAGLIRNRTQPY